MFHPGEDLALGGSVALEFVGHEHARHVGQPFKQLAKEFLCRPLVPATLDQDVQHLPVLIDRPPEIMALALDRQKHFIHIPLVAWPRTAATELISIPLTKLAAPFANRLIRYNDP